MSSTTTPSIQAAIQHLRAEIIAPDWRLSPQRLIRLRAALASLRPLFAMRNHALALLKMANSIVDHIENDDRQQIIFIEFLKEALAHIVNFYDEDHADPEREKETAQRLYKRFQSLNISLSTGEPQTRQDERNIASLLLDNLESLANETAILPGLLEQVGPLSPEDSRRAASLLGKISAAINIVWAHLPSATK